MYFGSQRVALAVVSRLATVKGEDALLEDAVVPREVGSRVEGGLEEAVVKTEGG